MTRGYVYVISNPSIPGMVKIGRTTRDVDIRAAELWRTGVPTPFRVWGSFGTNNCEALERFVHHDLREHRVHASREFFNVEPDEAFRVLRLWSVIQANLLLLEHDFEAVACAPEDGVLSDEAKAEARKLEVEPQHLIAALRFIPQDVMKNALALARSSESDAFDYDSVDISECDAP